MTFKQENEKEKILRNMAVPPKKKLEWLYKMHEFVLRASTKKSREIFWKLRESRQGA